MTKTIHPVVVYASLTLGLLVACAKDSDDPEAGSTQGDAGPSSRREGSTPLEPNKLEDAGQRSADASAADSGEPTRAGANGGAAGTAGDDKNTAGRGGAGTGEQPQPPLPDAGTSPDEPDRDSGPADPQTLCASCGGCEETIKVVSTMHTNEPVSYRDPPPTSGPHNPCWGRWGIHDEPLRAERWIHNLEHGGVVYLYNCPDGCDAEVATLKDIAASRSRTIVTAYADLPTRFGVVSWGHRLTSDCLDEQIYTQFYKQNFDHAPESNANPPNPTCPP